MIHPTAIIHPSAQLDSGITVEAYAVVDEHVAIGPGCRIGPHVYITGRTTIGSNNQFHAGGVIGDAPQDLRYRGEASGLRIGNDNVFREHATVHRSNSTQEPTIIGSNCLLMANSHVGHNTRLGDHVILANGALLGGHTVVENRAFISANCLVHQFVRVGTLALMQGGAGVSKDVPPYAVAHGDNRICGLNVVGLRRAEFSMEDRQELKRLYHFLFRSGRNLRAAAAEASKQFRSERARVMLDFILESKRGICAHGRGMEEGEED